MSDKITLKDAYEELWRCRDFELKHLWQRSIFLASLLVVVYMGYGSLIGNSFEKGLCGKMAVNCYGFGIAFIGIILSLLWIMLAKGSKAWYERYESAISSFIEMSKIDEHRKKEFFEDGANHIVAFAYGRHPHEFLEPVSSWLWNTRGGAYSPSRINVAIGHISFLIWLVVSVVHILLINGRTIVKHQVVAPIGMLAILFFGLIAFWFYAKHMLKSEILEEMEE